MRPLWEATRDLHHACEQHPVGAAMASGSPPMQWYSDWLYAIHRIHHAIDHTLPELLHRCERLERDIVATGIVSSPVSAACSYAEGLKTDDQIAGAAYVLTGAHLMGGEIMRRRLEGYPTAHLEWTDRPAAIAELKFFRERPELAEEARACFSALLSIMGEIEDRSTKMETGHGNV
jgi:heme oxygenase